MLTLAIALLFGAEPGVLDPLLTPAGLPRFEVERRLGDAGVILGMITDDEGRPLEGATIWLEERRGPSAQSGKDGTFSFTAPIGSRAPDRSDTLVVRLPGYVKLEGELTDLLTPRFVRLRLARALRFTARVALPDQPSSLSLRSVELPHRWYVSPWQTLGSVSDGGVTFEEPLGPGDYEVSIGNDTVRLRLPAKDAVIAPLTGRVQGRARPEPPGALDHVYVEAKNPNNYRFGGQQQLGKDGTFAYERLTPGEWTISAASRCSVRTVVVDGGTQHVEFDTRPGWGFRGRVVEANGKPPREPVWVIAEHPCSKADLTDGGSFAIEDLDADVSEVHVRVARLGPKDPRRWMEHGAGRAPQGPTLLKAVATPDAGFLVLTLPRPLPPRSISGKVVDAAGKPLAGVVVDPHGWPPNLHKPVKTDARGSFTVRAPFEEALMDMTFEKEGFVPRELHESEVKQVTLSEERKLKVRVVERDGGLLEGINDLAVRSQGPTRWQSRVTRGGAQAEFDAPAGAFVVEASLNDGTVFEQPFDAGVLDVVLSVPPR